MNKAMLLTASALAGAMVLPTAAVAQDTTQTGTVDPANNNGSVADDAADTDTIVVTGSRIARPNIDSQVPVTSVTADQVLATGNVSLGDALNELPALRSTYSQSNSTRFIGTTGLSLLDLRGLGVSRTLVLVNGKRHITSSEGDFLVDTNTIPTDLLERVDVVTGGSSAVYGSDAIGGVVNFILKRDFDGLSLKGQGGITSRKDRGNHFVSLTAGKNFADGRGNIAFSGEIAHQEALYFIDRPNFTGAYRGRTQFNLAERTAGEPAAGNGIPDNQFFDFRNTGQGVFNALTSDGGTYVTNCSTAASATPLQRANCLPNGQARIFRFNPNGTLAEANYGSIDFRPFGSNNLLGGVGGSTLRNTGQLNPGLERYAINMLAHFDVSDAFRPYAEAKFVRVKSVQEGQPSFNNSTFSTANSGAIRINFDNPFLDPAAAAIIRSTLAPGTNSFPLGRFNVDFGGRGEFAKRDTYRGVVGAEGTFNDDWKYDVSVNYGEFHNFLASRNNRLNVNFLQAVDAVRNASGQIVCRVNQTTITDPNCVPINVLGAGAPSQAALNYINTTTTYRGRASEFVVSGFVGGDLSQLFELPGGPVAFAVGAEYRREKARAAFDDLVRSGATFLNAIQPFNPPSAFEVKEAFAEINIPLLKDLPFVKELTLSGAGRVSDYKGAVGTVWAYNYGAVYAPISSLRFRGNYSKSVRAPTLSDLYTTPSQNFTGASASFDPCDARNINNGQPTRPANCAAAGIPAGFDNVPARTSSIEISSAGNPLLTEEVAKSYTVGGVFTPTFLRGFSVSVDYYNIKLQDQIASVSAQNIVNFCYDGATLDNPYCPLVRRNPDGTFGAPAVIQSTVNFAKQTAKGIDAQLDYSHKFSNGNALTVQLIGTYLLERNSFTDVTQPDKPNRLKSELGYPTWEGQGSINYKFGNVELGYQVRYIGRQTISTYEAQNEFDGFPPQNADQYPFVFYPDVFYHDIRVGVDVGERLNVYGGIDNLGDRLPPYGLLGTGEGDGIYNNIGRFMYVGAKVTF